MEALVFTKEELSRIKKSIIDGKERIFVDLHELTKSEAKRFLKNLINIHKQEEFTLQAIHGYNKGTTLRDMCRQEAISSRIQNIETDDYNDGVTIFTVVA